MLGDKQSDEPLCRDLCVRGPTRVVSVDYRHAPEQRFPAAADDAFAAVTWVAAHVQELGGIPGELAVAGWSAGGNLAAVACQMARDAGGPDIVGQVLLTPLTDYDMTRSSYVENADGYILTTALMQWFWDHYADPADRADPRVSPLRAADLSGLPPALVVTCEFDPLRDGQQQAQAGGRRRHRHRGPSARHDGRAGASATTTSPPTTTTSCTARSRPTARRAVAATGSATTPPSPPTSAS